MITVTNIIQTCGACPSQWEVKLSDGRMIYIRYRWGYLSICISSSATNDIMDAVGGDQIYGEQLGDNMDGCLHDEDMQEKLSLALKKINDVEARM